jgi:hypothetical protein
MNTRVLFIIISAAMLVAASPAPRPVWGQVLTPETIRRASFVEGVEAFFRYVDNKGRGYFTAGDFTLPGYHIAYPPVPYPQARAEAPFRCVDADRDGRISQQEYVGYAVRAFDATAQNGLMSPGALARAISSHAGCK